MYDTYKFSIFILYNMYTVISKYIITAYYKYY